MPEGGFLHDPLRSTCRGQFGVRHADPSDRALWRRAAAAPLSGLPRTASAAARSFSVGYDTPGSAMTRPALRCRSIGQGPAEPEGSSAQLSTATTRGAGGGPRSSLGRTGHPQQRTGADRHNQPSGPAPGGSRRLPEPFSDLARHSPADASQHARINRAGCAGHQLRSALRAAALRRQPRPGPAPGHRARPCIPRTRRGR